MPWRTRKLRVETAGLLGFFFVFNRLCSRPVWWFYLTRNNELWHFFVHNYTLTSSNSVQMFARQPAPLHLHDRKASPYLMYASGSILYWIIKCCSVKVLLRAQWLISLFLVRVQRANQCAREKKKKPKKTWIPILKHAVQKIACLLNLLSRWLSFDRSFSRLQLSNCGSAVDSVM